LTSTTDMPPGETLNKPLRRFRRPGAGYFRIAFVGAAVFVAIVLLYFGFIRTRLLQPHADSFRNGDLSAWAFYGGSWRVNDGVLENLSGQRGDKAVMGNSRWTDYVVETDIRLNADPMDWLWGDAGVILRTTDASIGVDAYDGYYVGIGSYYRAEGPADSVLLIGRANYAWTWLGEVPLGVHARRDSWFHLEVLAKGCYFEATARELASGVQARLTYFDHDCAKRAGAVGVRTHGLPTSWRNFVVRPPE
jgi:hypothetical protein